MELRLTATECHLPYGITQCYLTPDTSVKRIYDDDDDDDGDDDDK